MLTSSILNSVTFKNLEGNYPNRNNTLHENRRQGALKVIPYSQKFPNNHVLKLQFVSDTATVPSLTAYDANTGVQVDNFNLTLASSYPGANGRYFFNAEFSLGAAYHDKKIKFEVDQSAIKLTSEPICCGDYTTEIANGELIYFKYNNLDRESDLSSHFVDWSAIDYMDCFVEAVDFEPKTKDETEVLTEMDAETIISAQIFAGNLLKTGPVPDYISLRLAAASDLDVFLVNDRQMIKKAAVAEERFGNSTSVQVTLDISEKHAIGLNVDDLGIEQINLGEMAIIPKRNNAVSGGGWQVENPDGYMLHSVWITHDPSSTADVATVTLGTSPGGNDLIDAVQGSVDKSVYNYSAQKWKIYPHHFLKDPDNATQLYFSVNGAGAVMQIIANFDTVTEQQ